MLRFFFPRRRLPVVSLALLAALVLVAGCGNRNRGGGGGTANGSDGKVPGVLRYALTTEPTTLDPALVSDGPTIDLLMQVYEGLVGWNEKNEVVPLVARAMPTVSADGRTYTFVLRDNVKFTNGRAVTADDVKYSLTRSLDPKLNSSVASTYLNDIVGADALAAGKATELTGVKVVDPKTVQITLVEPRAYFLGKLTYATGYVVAREEVEKGPLREGGAHSFDATNSVGTGPFKLASYAPQSRVLLEANPDYWNGKPRLDRIERPIVLNAQTRRNLYQSGKLDILTDLPKSDYLRDRDDPRMSPQIQQFDRAAVFYLGMNQTQYAPFKDKRVRQAFNYAIDKDSIIKTVHAGVTARANGVVPTGIPGHDPEFQGLPYDPERAKQLLAEAGYPEGKGLPPLAITFRQQYPDYTKTCEVIQQQLQAVGIQASLQEMEWSALLEATNDSRVPCFLLRWSADYLDPQNFLSVLLHSKGPENRVGYSNPQYDALLDQADRGLDPAKRIAQYRAAERIVVDDAPWVPLYFQRDIELIKPHVKDMRDSLMGHLPHVTTRVE
uniref:ABC transporter, substrate-binding protein (Cluster 5, nickel/peptides/opines) n=1 Tax=uncultured Armatimonadetes bacterium TaxID=157466 RepID=A0A6J4J8D0_9BACT|nr:ABC transporter, substrate-binding protein (cluster 5, nickel/peptides/opines) [uncultured Armatimonadetes bacterium]